MPNRLWLGASVIALFGCGTATINDGGLDDETPTDQPPDGTGGGDGAGGGMVGGGGTAGTAGMGKGGSSGTSAVDGGGGIATDGGRGGSTGTGGTITVPTNVSAKDVATKLGVPAQFLWGLGNDGVGGNAPAYGLPGLKLHYVYLSSFAWTGWNSPEGQYARNFADDCAAHGIVPVMTFYQSAAWGDGNIWGFQQDAFMQQYWHNYDVLLSHMASFAKPVLIDVEPDFWGYAMGLVWTNYAHDPTAFPVPVTTYEPGCSDLPNDLTGFGRCMVRLAHQKGSNILIGFQPSAWAASAKPQQIADFMKSVGAADGDVVFTETLDRDAGCWEAAALSQCQGRSSAGMYWAAAGFTTHFAYVKTLTTTLGKPAIWWQTPMGVPSTTPGGSPDHYRDNRVATFFGDPGALVSAGGLGVMFGVGAGQQTTWASDGGQLKNALANYMANPVALP